MLTFEFTDNRVEFTALVDRYVNRDSGCFTNSLVVFTVGRRLVNDSGSVAFANVVVDQNLPSVSNIELGLVGIEIEDALVTQSGERGTHDGAFDSCNSLLARFEAEFFGVCPNQTLGQEVTGNHRVLDLWAYRERKVGRQSPRSGGPGEQLDAVKSLAVENWKIDRYGLVLAIAVDLVIHAQFVV